MASQDRNEPSLSSQKRKRRGRNEGSIYKRKDGRWAASLDVGWQDGKRKRKHFLGHTRAEVHKKLVRAQRDLGQGIAPCNDRLSVGAYLETWLKQCARPTVRPLTYESYACLVRVHLIPDLGRVQLSKLSPERLQSFLNHKVETGASARRVQMMHAVLRTALNQALRWGLVARNVATLVDPPRYVREPVRPLSPEEARRFMEAARGDSYEAVYALALGLGLRIGEVLGLRWGDIDLATGQLTVRHALQRSKSRGLELVEPKSRTSVRSLVLPAFVVRSLHQQQVRQKQQARWGGLKWQDRDLVFTTSVGTPIDADKVRRRFKVLLEQAGLRDMRLHDLRHSCASFLLAQGLQPRTIMELLGHSQISLTMNTYAHVMPSLMQDAAQRMDALFENEAVGQG